MEFTLSTAARTLSRGLRTSSPATAALGAALVAILLLRRRPKQADALLYRATLRPGKSLEVVLPESAPRRTRVALTPDT